MMTRSCARGFSNKDTIIENVTQLACNKHSRIDIILNSIKRKFTSVHDEIFSLSEQLSRVI